MSYLRTVAIEPWKQSACSAAAGTLTLPSGPVRNAATLSRWRLRASSCASGEHSPHSRS